MNFIGRTQELGTLSSLYDKDSFQMCIVYGRRRVGKTTLLKKFCEGKKCVYFTAVRSSIEKNTEIFGNKVLDAFAPKMRFLSFNTIESVFDFLAEQCAEDRVIVVIDEFPYLAEADRGILSVLQNYIDDRFQSSRMFLILSGSSVSFMEDEVLSEKSPLYGRRTAQMKVEPFGYRESAEFVQSYSPEDKALVYGITGGVAKYLSLFDEEKTADQNIADLFFSKDGYMYEEPSNLLTQEYRNVAMYNSIIDAVSAGRTKVNDISEKAHLENTVVSHALPKLITTGIIKKESAITDEKNNKKNQYIFKDTSFSFWYRFVPDGTDLIESGDGELYYEDQVKPYLSDFMGSVFEEMCRQYLLYLNADRKLPFLVTKTGKWWGTDPKKKEQTDIDVVGINPRTKEAVLGECKYKNELLDKEVFETLKERDGLLKGGYKTRLFMLFSKSGFTKWIKENCDPKGVMLVTLDDMYYSVL
ncbi:MAG: ATP-binding protein [Lachnospiraceae bacterium]|nr:ATP-binding protein [Lachnospiraceae bacterium]MDD7665700.1 ATP-binding protein [Lachnospiraceae bacterium]MDY4165107.1 ATP-binding protein [Lachnospiraceae bacterium]